jgi:hypothetical protein
VVWFALCYSVRGIAIAIDLSYFSNLMLFIRLVEAYKVDYEMFFLCCTKLDKVIIEAL